MAYVLLMSGMIVGRSELEQRDAATGTARGAFRPSLGYDLVQPIFALCADGADAAALERFRRAREALRLQLTDSAGASIDAREIHIARRSNGGGTELELRILTRDASFWAPRAS